MIRPYHGIVPKIHPTAFVEASAHVIGDVELGEDASVWFNVVIRAEDLDLIRRSAQNYISLRADYMNAEGR